MVSQNAPSTVFVVDDDRDMRESLQRLIAAMGRPVDTFPDGEAFRRGCSPHAAGCLVLDVHLAGESGLQLYERLLREGWRLPVIFITGHADVATAVAAMKTGAIEFLEKPFDRQTLQDRIGKALALDAEWRSQSERLQEVERRLAELTPKERATLELVVAGHSNKVTAARLGLTERAIELRRAKIMRKLGTESVAELLELALTHRIFGELRTLQDHHRLSW